MSTIQGYVQGTLPKKRLIAPLVKHFTENHENAICIGFQCQTYAYYTRVSTGRSHNWWLTMQGYVQSNLRKKKLVKKFSENIICITL